MKDMYGAEIKVGDRVCVPGRHVALNDMFGIVERVYGPEGVSAYSNSALRDRTVVVWAPFSQVEIRWTHWFDATDGNQFHAVLRPIAGGPISRYRAVGSQVRVMTVPGLSEARAVVWLAKATTKRHGYAGEYDASGRAVYAESAQEYWARVREEAEAMFARLDRVSVDMETAVRDWEMEGVFDLTPYRNPDGVIRWGAVRDDLRKAAMVEWHRTPYGTVVLDCG